MSMEFVGSAGGVPEGVYKGEFLGVEPHAGDAARNLPPGAKWKFMVKEGPQAGQVTSRITSLATSPKSGAGQLIKSMLGRELGVGERFQPQAYVGRSFTLVVKATPSGATRVDAVMAS